jgi:hypothetical protein
MRAWLAALCVGHLGCGTSNGDATVAVVDATVEVAAPQDVRAPRTRPLVGAIRWDAWVGDKHPVGLEVEATLSPAAYHYRVPFYGKELGPDLIEARATTQQIADQEIAYAAGAGIDYFAFVGYQDDTGLDLGRKLYLSSARRSDVRFAIIMASNIWSAIPTSELASLFALSEYVTVLDRRPLLFVLGASGLAKSQIDDIRTATIAKGVSTPYIVLLRDDSNLDAVRTLGMDALGMYATSWIANGAPYADLAAADTGQWDYVASLGYKIVPHVTSGWDTRPIHDHALSWYPDPGPNGWVVMPTPAELAGHVKEGLDWVTANAVAADAKTVLVYAWNEFAEGGFICPTLAAYDGSARLDALGAMLAAP